MKPIFKLLMTRKKFCKNTKSVFSRLLPHLKNKYILTLLLFLTWMLFFDRNDIFTQYDLKQQVNKLDKEKNYYVAEIGESKIGFDIV